MEKLIKNISSFEEKEMVTFSRESVPWSSIGMFLIGLSLAILILTLSALDSYRRLFLTLLFILWTLFSALTLLYLWLTQAWKEDWRLLLIFVAPLFLAFITLVLFSL